MLISKGLENKIIPVTERLKKLNDSYTERCIYTSNPLIVKLIDEFKRGFQARVVTHKTILCDYLNILFKLNTLFYLKDTS